MENMVDESVRLRINEDPKKFLNDARQSPPIAQQLFCTWHKSTKAADLLNMNLLDLPPTFLNVLPASATAQERATAYTTLFCFRELGHVCYSPDIQHRISLPAIEGSLLAGLGKILTWCSFFFKGGLDSVLPVPQRAPKDMIHLMVAYMVADIFVSLGAFQSVHQAMVDTPGTVEIATQMWLKHNLPQALMMLLRPERSLIDLRQYSLDPWNDKHSDILTRAYSSEIKHLERVISAAGSLSNVVDLVMLYLRTVISDLGQGQAPPDALAGYLIIFDILSTPPLHRIRISLVDQGYVILVTKLLVQLAEFAGRQPEPNPFSHVNRTGFVFQIVSAFVCLDTVLGSSDGTTRIIQALKHGLLEAWLVAAERIYLFPAQENNAVIPALFEKHLFPRLVYRKVLSATMAAIQKVKIVKGGTLKNNHLWRVDMLTAWQNMCSVASERYALVGQMKLLEKLDFCCDNTKCAKVDKRDKFRKCASCLSALYCSRECQVAAWKEGGHREECKSQREVMEYNLSVSNATFFHYLAIHDARRAMPNLRHLASTNYPSYALNDLTIQIDYTCHPPTFSLRPHTEDRRKSLPNTLAWRNGSQRMVRYYNEGLLKLVKESPGKACLIESRIVAGDGLEGLMVTCASGILWTAGDPNFDLNKVFAQMLDDLQSSGGMEM
ncbi:unnamed protein product [Cyclocybe aegerita]|uniref:MYND-type domain-containing protein n=1 Tax=Cyclocybe aegerita TaxID=1973307 RepID=A0A8S0VRA3_CYCAE|nr:unnamed protein product [Cyclocybe aegerita]